MERKLTAILSANVEGYSRLIERYRNLSVIFRVTFVLFLLLSFILFSGFRDVLKSSQSQKIVPSIKPSIAVLPFLDLSPKKDQEYFSDGMAEEILNALTKVGGLRVAARTSSFAFKGRNKDIPTIGERLNVDYVLEGSVRKAGNTIRITAQLINVDSGFHLWSEKYDRELKNIFAIQDEISQAITKALQIEIMVETGAPLVKPSTTNINAYDHYLQGRYHWIKRTEEGLTAAIKHFKQAVALDPDYALAYSGLADVYLVLPSYIPDINRVDVKAQAEKAVKKALALSPDLAEAHTSFGWLKEIYYRDYTGALREYRRAIILNPKYAPAHYRYSYLLLITGRLEEALVEARKAYELDPLSIFYNTALGNALIYARQYDAAIQQLERTLELDSNISLSWSFFGDVLLLDKRFEDATYAWVRWAELTGIDKEAVKLYVSRVAKHSQTGKPEYLTPELESSILPSISPVRLPIFYANLGQKEKTLELLELYYKEEKYENLRFYEYHPVFDFLQSEPRFIALMQKLGLEE